MTAIAIRCNNYSAVICRSDAAKPDKTLFVANPGMQQLHTHKCNHDDYKMSSYMYA